MILARWSIDARFGYKQTVIDTMRQWQQEIGPQVGWTADKARLLTGSVGAHESLVVAELVLNDLAELNASWDKLATIEAHREWSKSIEPYVVSGTSRWEIFRIL
jgi:hypothetical protein